MHSAKFAFMVWKKSYAKESFAAYKQKKHFEFGRVLSGTGTLQAKYVNNINIIEVTKIKNTYPSIN